MEPTELAASLSDDAAFRDRAVREPDVVARELGLSEQTVAAAAALVDGSSEHASGHVQRAALFALLAAVR